MLWRFFLHLGLPPWFQRSWRRYTRLLACGSTRSSHRYKRSKTLINALYLNLYCILFLVNPAPPPPPHLSRFLSLQETKLSPSSWSQVQATFSGHFGHFANFIALPSIVPLIPHSWLCQSECISKSSSQSVSLFRNLMISLPLSPFSKFCLL